MKKGKAVLSEHFMEYKLSDEQLKRLQDRLLAMFLDIKEICERNDIRYMMSGGSCLGAVRHKGFIPWDDDIDIMMTREEYNRFRTAFKKEKKRNYLLAEPLRTKGYHYKMPKIYDRNSHLVTVKEEGYRKFDMISIDIFIIENVPENKLSRFFRTKIYNLSFHAASVCLDYLYPSSPIEEKSKTDKDVRDYFTMRKRLGFIFSHVGGIEFYMWVCEKIANYPKKTSLFGVPSAISYDKEILPSEVFSDTVEGQFCGHSVQLPKGYDRYLTNLYKNYMELPPENKREVHMAYEIDI